MKLGSKIATVLFLSGLSMGLADDAVMASPKLNCELIKTADAETSEKILASVGVVVGSNAEIRSSAIRGEIHSATIILEDSTDTKPSLLFINYSALITDNKSGRVIVKESSITVDAASSLVTLNGDTGVVVTCRKAI